MHRAGLQEIYGQAHALGSKCKIGRFQECRSNHNAIGWTQKIRYKSLKNENRWSQQIIDQWIQRISMIRLSPVEPQGSARSELRFMHRTKIHRSELPDLGFMRSTNAPFGIRHIGTGELAGATTNNMDASLAASLAMQVGPPAHASGQNELKRMSSIP